MEERSHSFWFIHLLGVNPSSPLLLPSSCSERCLFCLLFIGKKITQNKDKYPFSSLGNLYLYVLLSMLLLLLIPRLQICICYSLVTHSMGHVYLYRVILLVSTYTIRFTFSFLFWLPGLQVIPQINKALLKCLAQLHVYEPTFYYEVWLCLSYWAWTRDMDEGIWGRQWI